MINDILDKFLDFSTERDGKWCQEMVRQVLLNAKQVITKAEYDHKLSVLYGTLDAANLDKIFSGNAMTRLSQRLSGKNVIFFEHIRNAIIGERNQANLSVTINSLDPEKEIKKQSDKKKLENRVGIEAVLNQITQGAGMPPMQVAGDDFHGNMDEFDDGGYDEMNDDDIEYFMDNHWGLKSEIQLAKVINPVNRVNKVADNFDKYINDILICLENFSQVYVDQVEGKMVVNHLYPYEVEVLHRSDSNSYDDADGFNLRRVTNVRGFMRKFGNNFDFDKDWNLLVTATYGYTNAFGQTYSGIDWEGRTIYGATLENCVTIPLDDLMSQPIKYGYCEYKAICKQTNGYAVTPNGNIIKASYRNGNGYGEGYHECPGTKSEDLYYEDTYYAYYFEPISLQTPHILKWGKLYMQNFEGMNDEYSGFSIKGNRRKGIPMVDILEPFHNLMQICFKMTEMLIADVKPDGLIINYSSILPVAEYLKANSKDIPDDQKTGIDLFLKMVEESPNLLADTPESEDGQLLGGGSLGVTPKKNGLNSAANDLIKIMDWIEQKVEKYLGTLGIDMTPSDSGYRLSLENKRRARNATEFIDFILLSHLRDITITELNYIQDISKYKDLPCYKYLESLAGEKAMQFISTIKKSVHRYGTVVDTFNNDVELAEIRAMAEQARQQKEISLEQYLVVRSYELPKQAVSYLAREAKKTQKQQQQSAMDAMRQKDALSEAEFQRKLKLEDRKGFWMKAARSEEAKGFYTAAQINANAQIAAKQIQEKGQNERLASNAVNEVDKIAKAAEARSQAPAPL